MFTNLRTVAIATILLLAVTMFASGQSLTSRVDGTIKDQTGGVLPGATVTLTNLATNAADTAIANDEGRYVFPSVTPGDYSLSAELVGFKVGTLQDVKVEVGSPRSADLILEVGDISEEVIVATSVGQLLQSVNAAVTTIVTREQVEELPLNGRNPTQLAYLQAGVTGRGEIVREASVNGMRGTFNNMTLDGVNNQDTFIRTDAFFGTIPVRESFVEEFSVTTSNADQTAGYGASQTQFVTRSGSNAFHGQVYFYHKNDAFNSNEFFNNAAGVGKPKLRDSMYGGTIGGPILKDKLFFFFGIEFEDVPQTVAVTRSVLTSQARSGMFSYLDNSGELQEVDLYGISGASPDPITSGMVNSTPLPNDPTSSGLNSQAYRFNSLARQDQRWITARVDYEVNDSHSIIGTFHNFKFELPNDPFNAVGEVFPGTPGWGQASDRYLGSLAWMSTWSPTLTNEARFGYQIYDAKWQSDDEFPSINLDFDTDLIDNPIQLVDFPQGRKPPIWQLSDNVNWVRGNHTIRFGGDYRSTKVNSFNFAGTAPDYLLGFGPGNPSPLDPALFPGGISTNDFTDAEEILQVLAGPVDSAQQTFNATSNTSGFVTGASQNSILKQNFVTASAGDTWRISPTVTLSFGLRWEWHGVPYEQNNLALLPKNPAIAAVLDPNAIIDYAGPGVGRPFFDDDYNNFAPNIGLAWRICDTWVVRAGYSMNYVNDNNITVVTNALRGNDGLSANNAVQGIVGTVSGGGLVPIPTPEFMVPRTARDNILLDSQSALYTIDPALRVPYVQQWNVGVQHEIMRDLAVEARYVGNRGSKLSRAIDINQVKFPGEFVSDWQRARRNLVANGDPYEGEELTYIPNLGFSGYMFAPFVQTWLLDEEIGRYVGAFLAPNRTFFFDGEGGEDFGSTVPVSDFYTNPNTFVGDYVGNNSYSDYHGLQLEARRRFSEGFAGQLNYSWGKVLTNFAGSQNSFRGLFDNAQPELEVMRPDYDIAHTINGNWIWEVPVGNGRRWMDQGGVADAILGGWNTTGIIRLRSGETVNIISQRGTINRNGSRALTNTVHLQKLNVQELQGKTGLYRDEEGRIRLFQPSLIGDDGRANPNIFQNPGLLEAGSLGMSPVNGPWYATFDFGLRKRFGLPLAEGSFLEFRFDLFNVFNRSNFDVQTTLGSGGGTWDSLAIYNIHNINASDFGVIDSTFSAREIQMGARIVF